MKPYYKVRYVNDDGTLGTTFYKSGEFLTYMQFINCLAMWNRNNSRWIYTPCTATQAESHNVMPLGQVMDYHETHYCFCGTD